MLSSIKKLALLCLLAVPAVVAKTHFKARVFPYSEYTCPPDYMTGGKWEIQSGGKCHTLDHGFKYYDYHIRTVTAGTARAARMKQFANCKLTMFAEKRCKGEPLHVREHLEDLTADMDECRPVSPSNNAMLARSMDLICRDEHGMEIEQV